MEYLRANIYFHPTNEHSKLSDGFEQIKQITGKESAAELDLIASGINDYYRTLTPTKYFNGNQRPKTHFFLFNDRSNTPFVSLFRQLQKEEPGSNFFVNMVGFFLDNDIYMPVIQLFLEEIKNSPADRLGSLIYLLYQIENIFVQESEKAKDKVDKLEKIRTDSGKEPLRPETKRLLTLSVNEFMLAEKDWKNAWAYFGRKNAHDFLAILDDPKYGRLLFEDMVWFADKGSFLFPPQIYSLIRSIGDRKDNIGINVGDLIVFYDQGKRLIDLADNSNILITGENRIHEYTLSELRKFIPPSLRQASILALGGCLGLIEIGRAKILRIKGQIINVDEIPRVESIRRSLVLRNELRFDPFEVETPHREIYQRQREVDYCHIPARLPLTLQELEETVRKHSAGDLSRVRIISDQRASALYLSGNDLLQSIRTSVSLLFQNGGGVYFLTRGLTDRLAVDLVLRIDKDCNYVLCLEHTSSFLSKESLIKGRLPRFCEGKVRVNSDGNYLVFQPQRESKPLRRQQIATTIEYIIELFIKSKEFTYNRFLSLGPGDAYFDNHLVIAYARKLGLPIALPRFKDKKLKYQYIKFLNFLIEVINTAEQNPDLLQYLEPIKIEGIDYINDVIDNFISLLKDEQKRNDFIRALGLIKKLLDQVNILNVDLEEPRDLLSRTVKLKNSSVRSQVKREEKFKALKEEFIKEIKSRFGHYPVMHDVLSAVYCDEIVFDAICIMYGINGASFFKPEFKGRDARDYEKIIKEVIKKIYYLSNGKSYRMDFSGIKDGTRFGLYIQAFELFDQDIELWLKVIAIADTVFVAKSRQGV